MSYICLLTALVKIFSNIKFGGTRDYHVEQDKRSSERQKPYFLSYEESRPKIIIIIIIMIYVHIYIY
jgi:hypothetical protein